MRSHCDSKDLVPSLRRGVGNVGANREEGEEKGEGRREKKDGRRKEEEEGGEGREGGGRRRTNFE